MQFRNKNAIIIRKVQKACNVDTLVSGGTFFIAVAQAKSSFWPFTSIMCSK